MGTGCRSDARGAATSAGVGGRDGDVERGFGSATGLAAGLAVVGTEMVGPEVKGTGVVGAVAVGLAEGGGSVGAVFEVVLSVGTAVVVG